MSKVSHDEQQGSRPSTASAGGLQSVDRALSVLELLATRGEGGVRELPAELDVHNSMAFRLLGAPEAHGLVEQTEERERLVKAGGLPSVTPETITDEDTLTKELDRILDRGYATAVGEYEESLNAMTVPVRGADGSVVAALSAPAPRTGSPRNAWNNCCRGCGRRAGISAGASATSAPD